MEIEWLKFRVVPELRERFVQKDDEIWTRFLSQYPGFLGKEIWISPENTDEVICVIRWASFEQWQAIPSEDLQAIDQRFNAEMGENTFTLLTSNRYQVRKFPQ